MSQKSIAIIGAGIAGLSAGCYAQMNGYRTQIFEQHSIPGGLCTSWTRKGYTFDGCIHHLAGASPSSGLYRLWQELGAVQERPMVFHDYLVQVEDQRGKALTVYTDLDQLDSHLRRLAPDNRKAIDEYTGAIRRLVKLELLAMPLAKPGDLLKTVPLAPSLIKWMRVSLGQFAQRFSDPFVRRALPVIQYDFAEIPMLVHLNFMVGCHNRTLGWPVGGSRAFAASIAERYAALGGDLHYRSRVAEILVDGIKDRERAVGLRLADGSEHPADVVISAADGHATHYELLGGRYVDARTRTYYANVPDRQDMNTHVSFGVDRDMTAEPHALCYLLQEPIDLLGKERNRISIEVFSFDPSMAPAGKAVVKVPLDASYSHWKALHAGDRQHYDAAKQQVAERVLAVLEQRFPGITSQVEVVDVATPVTIERYTGNWHGSQPWIDESAGMLELLRGKSKTLRGLDRFYMAGQWAGGIGLSTAAIQGRKAIQAICTSDRRRFTTSIP